MIRLYRYLERFLTRNHIQIKLKHIYYVEQMIPMMLRPQYLLDPNEYSLFKRFMSQCFEIEDGFLSK